MKTRSSLLLLGVLAFAATAVRSHANPFNFTYTFDTDNSVVTGSFDGTADGLFIDNVTNISLSFGGTAITGPIYLSAVESDGTSAPGGVVSFDVTQNNFAFATSDLASGDGSWDSIFGISNAIPGEDYAFAQSYSLGYGSQDLPPSSSWSVTPAAVASVPDSGATVVLLSLALVGLMGFRRYRSLASAA
jgi:hypothetical protein